MEAVVFVGIQGSGKTSFYRERFFNTHIRISLDMLRTRHREEVLFRACLAARQSFVIDNTNPLRSDRARYIPEARHAGFRVVAYYFEVPLRDAMERNNQRSGKERIPPMALARLSESYKCLPLMRDSIGSTQSRLHQRAVFSWPREPLAGRFEGSRYLPCRCGRSNMACVVQAILIASRKCPGGKNNIGPDARSVSRSKFWGIAGRC